ncbi:ATP synthase F1 subunit epsilon [Mycoplasmatota bacterium]|nr:ATP synthase F1 subunit epsilon [Mycoplasmatota bacterium]
MIKINVVTPEGKLFEEDASIIIVRNSDGEQAIMQDHTPIVIAINPGYVRLIKDNETLYVTIIGGFLEFSNNLVNVVAQEAEIGKDHENALKHLADLRKKRLDENKRKNIDFTKAERDLKEQIKNINASKYQ